jgi:hypothetical protein
LASSDPQDSLQVSCRRICWNLFFQTKKGDYRHRLPNPRFPRRVARWFIFKPKIPIWVHFRGT